MKWSRRFAIDLLGVAVVLVIAGGVYLFFRPRPYIDPSFSPAEQEFLRREMMMAGKMDNFIIIDAKGVPHANRPELLENISAYDSRGNPIPIDHGRKSRD